MTNNTKMWVLDHQVTYLIHNIPVAAIDQWLIVKLQNNSGNFI